MLFVIFHGSYGTINENWIPWLKSKLEELGQEVLLEQFPVESYKEVMQKEKGYASSMQNKENWEKHFLSLYTSHIKQHPHVIFIGHSIAPVFYYMLLKSIKFPYREQFL